MRLWSAISPKRYRVVKMDKRVLDRMGREWEKWKVEHPISHVGVVSAPYDWEVDGE